MAVRGCFSQVDFLVVERRGSLGAIWASLVVQWYRTCLLVQETQKTQGRSRGRGNSLEEEVATHSSILAWRLLWTEELGGLRSVGLQRVRQD